MEFTLYHFRPLTLGESYVQSLATDIDMFASKYTIRGMEKEDVKQDLTFHLWRKLDKYHAPDEVKRPGRKTRAGFRTWAHRVMRNRCTDLSRRNTNMLDQDRRVFAEEGEELKEPGTHLFTLVDLSNRDKAFFDLFFGE